MAQDHILRGYSFTAVARQEAGDDVLYLVDDGRLAQVHLTWSRQSTANWPSTFFHDTSTDFVSGIRIEASVEASMALSFTLGVEHEPGPLICPLCNADWVEGYFSNDCPCCGEGALARACPVCGGVCGSLFKRAVADSLDQKEAVWIGQCDEKALRELGFDVPRQSVGRPVS